MSAFVVDKRHIDVIIKAALDGPSDVPKWDEIGLLLTWFWEGERYELTRDVASNVGQMLVDENVRSVAYYYPDCDPDSGNLPGPIDAYYMGPYIFDGTAPSVTLAELGSAIHSLEYQSCEHPEWRESQAFVFCLAVLHRIISRLPGYDKVRVRFDA